MSAAFGGQEYASAPHPDKLIGGAKVMVNEAVSHACYATPLNRRVLRTKFTRELLGSFADDLETAHKCSAQNLVRLELVRG